MAEGIEEAESNNSGGETTVMLGAVMPCEMTSSSMGGIKRELETAATATSPATTPIIQQQPINLKSEDFDRDHESPSNSPARPLSRNSNYGIFGNQILSPERNLSQEHAKNAAAVAAAQAHFSGTMQGMLNLQKLQNLASMQHSTMPSLQSLQDLTGLTSVPSLNSPSPLNLSVGAGQTLPSCTSVGGNLGGIQMPQLILASGQLMQGIQGAQLLIPTSQGITTQTILTIPVSQQISSSEHLAQSLANLNGNSNLGKMNIPQNHIMHPSQSGLGNSNILSPHHLSTSVQQLLTAIQPQLFSQSSNQSQNIHQQQQQQQQQQHQQQQQQQHQQSSILTSQQISPVIHTRVQTPKASPPRSLSSTHERHHPYEKLMITTSTTISQSQPQQTLVYTHPSNGHSQISTSPHLLGSRVHSPTSLALNNINRLAATNGEITITKSHGPSPSLGSSSSSSSHIGGPQLVPQIKLSPSSMHLSPTESDASGADLLDDSPNEPTINQTNCNVVDGIDLDEIKEFAKAFKLRRLSLGLTQTQVGQALSVTEGPAYSQSAICSALAAQMYAAQLSSQQQAMFEKLDITPKSAQKIKPVLERWMKEAEERYKSGQNHLTDFIGVEPSKKRKRRTSFTPQALELLNAHFERNTHPSGTEITGLAHQLGYEREVIRIWFCNKRQALKNTVRMMSKGLV